MNEINTFTRATEWIVFHGYQLLPLAVLVQGPLAISAAGFAAATGHLNPFFIFLIASLTGIAGDSVYYAVGYLVRVTFVEKYGHYFGLSQERVSHLEDLLHENTGKTIWIIKLLPFTPMPGLMLVGGLHVPFRKFIAISAFVSSVTALLFTILGYYFGFTYVKIIPYFNFKYYLLAVLVVILILMVRFFMYATTKIATKMEQQ